MDVVQCYELLGALPCWGVQHCMLCVCVFAFASCCIQDFFFVLTCPSTPPPTMYRGHHRSVMVTRRPCGGMRFTGGAVANTRLQLVPPKPKLLLMATWTGRCSAVPPTKLRSSGNVGSGLSRLRVGGSMSYTFTHPCSEHTHTPHIPMQHPR